MKTSYFLPRCLLSFFLLLVGSSAQADKPMAEAFPDFRLRGFGSLGLLRSSSQDADFVRDLSQPDGSRGSWTGKADSLLGVQGNYRFNDEWEAVAQAAGAPVAQCGEVLFRRAQAVEHFVGFRQQVMRLGNRHQPPPLAQIQRALASSEQSAEQARTSEDRMRRHRDATGVPFEQQLGDRICLTSESKMPHGGIIVLRQDMTDQRRLEQKHQDAEDLLRNLFENFGHGIMIRDRDTRLIRANRAALEQIGLSADQAVGKTTSEMFALMGVEDFTGDVGEQEIRMMDRRETDEDLIARAGPDGRQKYVLLSRFPLIDRNDEVKGLGVLRYDVTELIETQKELEAAKVNLEKAIEERTEELRVSERRFRILAHASADWFWECDEHLRFTYLSENFPVPAGGTPASLIGLDIAEYHKSMWDNPEVSRALLSAYEAREPVRDFEAVHKIGDAVGCYRINATPLWNKGIFEGYTGATTDISELYQARESLVESERLASLGSMVAGIAHEINTPVGICVTAGTTVLSAAHMLQDGFKGGGLKRSEFEAALTKIIEGMNLVDSNLARAAKLISSFKSIAVDQASEAERTFNLVAYLRDISNSLSPNLGSSKISVDIVGPEDIELKSYPGAFAQIVTNLVMNSVLHGFAGREEGSIVIEVSVESGTAELRYTDDGIGMEEETVKRVFDPFFTTKRGQGGSGLGMHILFNLVTQILRGTVRCKSAPGEGVEILIRFPVIPAENY